MFAQAGMWDAVISLGAWGAGIVLIILGTIWMLFSFLRWMTAKWIGPAILSVVKTHSDFLTGLSNSMRTLNESAQKQCDQLDVVNAKLEQNGKILEGSGIRCPIREEIEELKSKISPKTWNQVKESLIEEFKKRGKDVSEVI